MNDIKSETEATNYVEIAAGGLVWSCEEPNAKICIVQRKNHGDWVLPKGRLKPGEPMENAALREVSEETGRNVRLIRFAGVYNYVKEGSPKIVLMWHMSASIDGVPNKVDEAEISEVCWLPPREAHNKVTHEGERNFLAVHCQGVSVDQLTPHHHKSKPTLIRLAAAISTVRTLFAGLIEQSGYKAASWWADCASRSLGAADRALKQRDLDGGWSAVHDAERYIVHGMPSVQLVTRAAHLSAEAGSKLTGWRAEASKRLMAAIELDVWIKQPSALQPEQINLLRHVVVESMQILHSHSDNVYHRMHLVGKQLGTLVAVCSALLSLVFAVAYFYAPATDLSIEVLLPIALAGAFGGVVSAMYQLSRVGQAKIPEALLHGLITSGRPLVGASAALFIYVAMKSEIVSLVAPENISLTTGLVLGFISGFSEQFVLSTVAKVAGSEKEQPQG